MDDIKAMSNVELAQMIDHFFRGELHAPDVYAAAQASQELLRRLTDCG